MKDIPYQERLERLKLPTLAYKRTRGDMIEAYNLMCMLQEKFNWCMAKPHQDSAIKEGTRGHNLKLLVLHNYGVIYRK